MHCSTALEILESARPGFEEALDPAFADALAHVEDCPECLAALQHRRALDERIGRAMRDVPVPPGLEVRLLGALRANRAETVSDSEQLPATVPLPALARPKGLSRRAWIRTGAVIAAASVLAGTAIWQAVDGRSNSRVTVADLSETAPLSLEGLAPFDGSFDARLPRNWVRSRQLTIGPARGFSLSGGQKHGAALFPFTAHVSGNAYTTGILLVVPERALADHPELTYFHPSAVKYTARSAVVDWRADGLVYVCFVKSGQAAELVARALEVHPA